MKEDLPNKFCRCIKKVRKTLKANRKTKESRAISICVSSVLQKKRRITLKSFKCRDKPWLKTQNLKGS